MALIQRPGGLLVTRGLGGPTTQVIVRGFLPLLIDEIAEVARGARVHGRRRKQELSDLFEELQISVALLAINGKELINPIINKVSTTFKSEPALKIEVTPKKLSVKQPEIIVEVQNVRSKNVLKD